MKITKIEKESVDTFVITFRPNFFGRLFGKKEVQKKFKKTEAQFEYFPGVGVYINQEGEMLHSWDKITKKLDNFQRAF